ncbi:nuclear transport factor 2 family protein [Streptomyces fenghuangensis]|uniref:nuclear transport factor 2 family protein n=1 Tax=Streptomyces sp. ICN903 TaxID=2964654 RepID=UPI001EDB6712|nr:nuclear transport factor 2 family protein [Streptomyces sp. ICN903]MCG3039762.1 nuclear transport factor 2 family protein [Streptomyces sp. ICN903]
MNSHDLATTLVPGDLYLEIQQFYALQLKILDRGDGEQWARTFTPDGVFQAADMPDPLVGRDMLTKAIERQTGLHEGLVLRHWMGQLTVERLGDDTVRAQSYVMVYVTPDRTLLSGEVHFRHHTLCDDELVRVDGTWFVRNRFVETDGDYK